MISLIRYVGFGWSDMKKIVLSVFLFLSFSVEAGEYLLIGRESYPLCRDLVENFNRFKDEPPMVCERRFHPDMKQFTLPDWIEVNAQEYKAIIARILTKEKKRAMSFEIVEHIFNKPELRLYRSMIDINFDGRKNTVYMMVLDSCGVERNYKSTTAPRYIFMAERSNKHDDANGFEYFNGSVYGGIFYYKGRPYLHSWTIGSAFGTDLSRLYSDEPKIHVYETSSPYGKLREDFSDKIVCEIVYKK